MKGSSNDQIRLLTRGFNFHSIAFILVFLISSLSSFPQLNTDFLKQYTEQNGIPGAQVNRILPDRFGYIWIGTINGLARYDGYEFKRYFNNPNDTSSIEGLVIWSIFEDSRGRIWISSGPGHLNMYSPVTRMFKRYSFEKLVEHPATVEVDIAAIGEDGNGRIYLGVSTQFGNPVNDCILYLDEKDDKLKKFETKVDQPISNVLRIKRDVQGNIWFLSYNGMFSIDKSHQLSGITAPRKYLLADEYPTDFDFDKSGHPWLITNRGRLFDFDLADSSVKIHQYNQLLVDNFRNNITIDQQDRLWMGTNIGLIRFNKEKKLFEEFAGDLANPLKNVNILAIAIDSFGTAWIGTVDRGLFKYEEKALFRSYKNNPQDRNSIRPGWANVVYRMGDNKIYITTSDQGSSVGINVLDPASGKMESVALSHALPRTYTISALYEDVPGELILSTDNGLHRFSASTKKVIPLGPNDFPAGLMFNRFYEDHKGNLWLCTVRGLFKRTKGTRQFKKYDLSILPGSDASSNEITMAFESKRGGLWLTTNNGLFFYNYESDKIERHGFEKKAGDVFVTQDINSLYESNDSTLWVGGWQGGLSMYNPGTKRIKSYTRDDGLPSMSVQGILADEKNNGLWLSTFDGLSYFDLATKQFINFTISDGIQGQLFADGAMLRTADDLFIFGGANGITAFRTNDIIKNTTAPKVFLTDLKLFNKSVFPGEKSVLKNPIYDTREIILAHNQNNISLDFVALHFADPAKNKYLYKLENYDDDWREAGSQHVATYSNLSPGKYDFIVKASNNNGVWNEEGARLSIIIQSPWWRTGWAYLGYLLLMTAAAFVFNNYMRNRLLRQERERSRAKELEQAREIEKAYYALGQTHETLKATQSQLIQSEKMASLGQLTAGIAHEIQNPLNFVNNFSDVNKELLTEMKAEIEKGNLDEAKILANDVISNEEKINHHGKRADDIVKGMLQHSQSGRGQKEPTDINALADEYLRLSYHGFRARDSSFSASIKTDFDESIGQINIIPQDIGRVLLNLYNNALYAVNEKRETETGNGKDNTCVVSIYQPQVSVRTKKMGNKVQITVTDNGSGIPEKIIHKIFQPFFTTKPTGQGTGLGLSLTYEIVKTYGGEIIVNPASSSGTAFVVTLPA